jgi:hypothetical protein
VYNTDEYIHPVRYLNIHILIQVPLFANANQYQGRKTISPSIHLSIPSRLYLSIYLVHLQLIQNAILPLFLYLSKIEDRKPSLGSDRRHYYPERYCPVHVTARDQATRQRFEDFSIYTPGEGPEYPVLTTVTGLSREVGSGIYINSFIITSLTSFLPPSLLQQIKFHPSIPINHQSSPVINHLRNSHPPIFDKYNKRIGVYRPAQSQSQKVQRPQQVKNLKRNSIHLACLLAQTQHQESTPNP